MNMVLGKCTNECGFDFSCQLNCIDEFNKNMEKCPCGEFCVDGCPCNEWLCYLNEEEDRHDHVHMIVFNPKRDNHSPTGRALKVSLIDRDTRVDEEVHEINFEYDGNWKVLQGACSFVYQDQMFIASNPHVNVINDNKITLFAKYPSNSVFDNGLCASGPTVLLCSSRDHRRKCWSWDLNTWTESTTEIKHYRGGLVWSESALIFGGLESEGKTEKLIDGKWKIQSESYLLKDLTGLTVVNFHDNIYCFGGQTEELIENKVLSYKDQLWRQIGSLRVPRAFHTSLVFGEKIVHVGGHGQQPYEVWTWLGPDKFDRDLTQNRLIEWVNHPHSFPVDENSYTL